MGSSSLIVGSVFICKALTLCRTRLSLLFARGPLTDDVRSSLEGSGAADGREAIETDLVNDPALGGVARSTTLGLGIVETGLIGVEIVRRGISVGTSGIGTFGGWA